MCSKPLTPAAQRAGGIGKFVGLLFDIHISIVIFHISGGVGMGRGPLCLSQVSN